MSANYNWPQQNFLLSNAALQVESIWVESKRVSCYIESCKFFVPPSVVGLLC